MWHVGNLNHNLICVWFGYTLAYGKEKAVVFSKCWIKSSLANEHYMMTAAYCNDDCINAFGSTTLTAVLLTFHEYLMSFSSCSGVLITFLVVNKLFNFSNQNRLITSLYVWLCLTQNHLPSQFEDQLSRVILQNQLDFWYYLALFREVPTDAILYNWA